MKRHVLRKKQGNTISCSSSLGEVSRSSLFSLLVTGTKTRLSRRAQAKARLDHSKRDESPEGRTAVSCSSEGELSTTKKKKVRFARRGYKRTIPSHRHMADEQWASVWYTAAERDDIRHNARHTGANMQSKGGEVLASVFMNARFLAATTCRYTTDKLLHNGELLRKNTKRFLELVSDYNGDTMLRGLEDYAMPICHQLERADVAKNTRLLVLETQLETLRPMKGSHLGLEDIAREYREMARPAVIFARLLAETDAVVAAQDH